MSLRALLAAADAAEDELLDLYLDLLRFETVNTGIMPTGHETPCAEFLREQLARDGVAAEVWEAAPERGNLLARLPGRGGGRSLLLMSHLDVVPPGDPQRWSHPPFDPIVRDGWVQARGANDCKGLVAAEVQAMRLLARCGVELDGDLLLACGADEETGGRYGFGALAEQRPEALRADLGINEGGGSPARLDDGRLACLVATGEKGRYEATLTLRGGGGHAAMPWGTDPVMARLAEVLQRLDRHRPTVHVDHPAMASLPALWGVPLPAAEALDELLADRDGHGSADAGRSRSLSRMTLTPTLVSGGSKSNAVPDRVTLTLDVRTLPHQDERCVRQELSGLLGDIPGLEITVGTTALAGESPWSEDLRATLEGAFADLGQVVECLPTLCVGFTDARLVRRVGTPVVGFAPLPADTPLERCGCHNIDEQFPFAAVRYRTRVLLALAWRFCRRQQTGTSSER